MRPNNQGKHLHIHLFLKLVPAHRCKPQLYTFTQCGVPHSYIHIPPFFYSAVQEAMVVLDMCSSRLHVEDRPFMVHFVGPWSMKKSEMAKAVMAECLYLMPDERKCESFAFVDMADTSNAREDMQILYEHSKLNCVVNIENLAYATMTRFKTLLSKLSASFRDDDSMSTPVPTLERFCMYIGACSKQSGSAKLYNWIFFVDSHIAEAEFALGLNATASKSAAKVVGDAMALPESSISHLFITFAPCPQVQDNKWIHDIRDRSKPERVRKNITRLGVWSTNELRRVVEESTRNATTVQKMEEMWSESPYSPSTMESKWPGASMRLIQHLVESHSLQDEKEKRKKGGPLVILLYGPAGIGKTEMAKYTAECMYKKEISMLIASGKFSKYNMGQFSDPTQSSSLFGSASGLTGASSGILPDAVRKDGNGIIVLDDFDKLHFSLQMQFLGMWESSASLECKDAQHNAQTLSVLNVTFILTSNHGADLVNKVWQECIQKRGNLPTRQCDAETLQVTLNVELDKAFDTSSSSQDVLANPAVRSRIRLIPVLPTSLEKRREMALQMLYSISTLQIENRASVRLVAWTSNVVEYIVQKYNEKKGVRPMIQFSSILEYYLTFGIQNVSYNATCTPDAILDVNDDIISVLLSYEDNCQGRSQAPDADGGKSEQTRDTKSSPVQTPPFSWSDMLWTFLGGAGVKNESAKGRASSADPPKQGQAWSFSGQHLSQNQYDVNLFFALCIMAIFVYFAVYLVTVSVISSISCLLQFAAVIIPLLVIGYYFATWELFVQIIMVAIDVFVWFIREYPLLCALLVIIVVMCSFLHSNFAHVVLILCCFYVVATAIPLLDQFLKKIW